MKETNPDNRATVAFWELSYEWNGLNDYELPQFFAPACTANRTGFHLADARQSCPTIAKNFDELGDTRFHTVDHLWSDYPGQSPWSNCAANPINFIDPSGLAWYMTADYKVHWTDYTSQEDLDNNNIQGTYLGAAYVDVIGSRNERFEYVNGRGYIVGDNAINAQVIVYGPKNKDDIHNLTGFTMTSDAEKYGPIDEGLYSLDYSKVGKGGSIPSNWILNKGGHVRVMDGKKNPNPGFEDQIEANGDGYKTRIWIHRTNMNGTADRGVSTGCLLLTPQDYGVFNSALGGINTCKIQVSRYSISVSRDPLNGGVIVTRYLKRD